MLTSKQLNNCLEFTLFKQNAHILYKYYIVRKYMFDLQHGEAVHRLRTACRRLRQSIANYRKKRYT